MKKHPLLRIILSLTICTALLIAPVIGAGAYGTADAPEAITLDADGCAKLEAAMENAYPGACYSWTAESYGELKIALEGVAPADAAYYVTAYVDGNAVEQSLSISKYSDSTEGTLLVDAGQTVIINLFGEENEAVNVAVNLSFTAQDAPEKPVSTWGPENAVATDSINRLTYDVKTTGDVYYFVWTAPSYGQVSFFFGQMVSGAVLFTYDGVYENAYFENEPLTVTEGQQLYIGLGMNPRLYGTPGTYTLYGIFTEMEAPAEPEQPVDPEQPVVPEQPVDPEQPVEPEQPNPGTGDPIALTLMTALCSGSALVVMARKKEN